MKISNFELKIKQYKLACIKKCVYHGWTFHG
jgi:hypothetical protein